MLAIPCGDFNWMRTIDLSRFVYIGADLVPDFVHANQHHFSSDNISFSELD